jgi:molybdenum cofactor cytidylyltransferase
MSHPVILILAAGASSRMGGRDKLLEPVQSRPLLRLVVERALVTGAGVIVVLPPDRPERASALGGLTVQAVTAQDAAQGMTASLRAGLAALPAACTSTMILPGDMPGITSSDLSALLTLHTKHPHAILRGTTADGREGHPALFPADLFPALMALTGDEGGRSVLKAHRDRVRLVALPGDHATLDLDTPEDWAAYRAATAGSGGQ